MALTWLVGMVASVVLGVLPVRWAPVVYAGGMLLVGVLLLLVARGRLRITQEHVIERTWRSGRVIRRDEVTEIVVVEQLLVLGRLLDCVLLVDRFGRCLWRSALECWPEETVAALLDSGPQVTTMPLAVPADLEARWPGSMPALALHPVRWVVLSLLALLAVCLPLGFLAQLVPG